MPQTEDADEGEETVAEEPPELKAADADADAGEEEEIAPGQAPAVAKRTPPRTQEEAPAVGERPLLLPPQRSTKYIATRIRRPDPKEVRLKAKNLQRPRRSHTVEDPKIKGAHAHTPPPT